MAEPTTDPRQVAAQVEHLLDDLRAQADVRVTEKAEHLVALLMQLYGAAFESIVGALEGDTVLRLADDPLIASLLILHGVHPLDTSTRVQQALDRVRPYLGSHAGGVEFLGIDEAGRAHLRLEGSCHGCPSSTVTVRQSVERAIEEAAPEVMGIEVEGMAAAPTPGLIQLNVGPPPQYLECTVPDRLVRR